MRRAIGFAAALLAALSVGAISANAESWTDLAGTRTVQAKMIGMWDDNVILEMEGGRRVKVPLQALRSESRIQAQSLWETIKRSRQSRVEELQGKANAAAAPAPNPIPEPPAVPAYTKPLPNATATDFLQHLDDQLAAGHLVVIFDSLPPSYQKDVVDLVRLAASKIDPVTWNSAIAAAQQLGDVVVTRQNWFFSNPRLESLPAGQYEDLHDRLLLVSGMLRRGLHPDAMDLQQLQSGDLRQWLMGRDEAIAPYLAALIRLQGVGQGRNFSVVSEAGGKARIKMSVGGQQSDLQLVNVEGFWVPQSMAATWADSVASQKLQLQNMQPGTYLAELNVLSGSQLMVMPLATADSEQRFHAVMETAFDALRPVLTSVASTVGMNMSLAGNTTSGRQDRGYGSGESGPGYGGNEYGPGYGGNEYGEGYDESMEEMETGDGYESEEAMRRRAEQEQ